MKKIIATLVSGSLAVGSYAQNVGTDAAWPYQISPQTISVCAEPDNVPEAMLLASMSGVAAKSVNAEDYEEMVWTSFPDGSAVFKAVVRAIKPFTTIETNVWELLGKYADAGIVKGYVLYTAGNERSVNAATAYASSLDAIMADESLQGKMESYGLKLLEDCRGAETADAESYATENIVVVATADDAGFRDFAIAYGVKVIGPSESVPEGVVAIGRVNDSVLNPFVFGSKSGNLPVLISAERHLAAKEEGEDADSEDLEISMNGMFHRINSAIVR